MSEAASYNKDWKRSYEGREGYLRMYDEMREGFFKEFPELVGKVEVFNYAADPEAEMQRIASSLGLKREDLGNTTTEETTTIFVPGADRDDPSSRRTIAWGVNPFTAGPDTYLSFYDVDFLAWHLTHEMAHAADGVLYRTSDTTAGKIPERVQSRWVESLADSVRVDLNIKNYGAQPDTLARMKNFSVAYDLRSSAAPLLDADTDKLPMPQRLATSWLPSYDNGELMTRVVNSATPYPEASQSYVLKGWRDSVERVAALRAEWGGIKPEGVETEIATSTLLSKVQEQFREQTLRKLEPFTAALKEDMEMTPEQLFENYFGTREIYSAANPQGVSPTHQAINIVKAAQDDYIQWLSERLDFIPTADRILAADAFLSGKTHQVGDYTTPVLSPIQGMARAVSSFLKTGDVLDMQAAEIYSAMPSGLPYDVMAGLRERLYEDDGLRESMVAGPASAKTVSPAPGETSPQTASPPLAAPAANPARKTPAQAL